MSGRACLFIIALSSAVSLGGVARAQQPPQGRQGKAPAKETSAAKNPAAKPAEVDPAAEMRRSTAVSLVNALADDARMYRDPVLRARVQARAADALWEIDAERARAMFRRAWEAADSADREAARKMEEEINAQLSKHGSAVSSTPPDLRAEVLKLAARRDRALGEEFLKQLASPSGQKDGEAASDATSTSPTATPAATSSDDKSPDAAQRLGLAEDLLNEGDTQHALQFADAALNRANIQSVSFLSALREKDAAEADRRFAAMLVRAAADPASDANTVSTLSSYVFTPFNFFAAYRSGSTGTNAMRGGVAPPDASALRAEFLRVAAQILLRPPTPQDYERTSAGRNGAYLIIRRLLPRFESQAPDLAPALNARAAALLPDVPEGVRNFAEREASRSASPDNSQRDMVQESLERAEHTNDPAERDAIYAMAVTSLAWKGDPRAQEYLDKIEDLDLKHRVRAFADFSATNAALEKKDAEAAVERAHKGDLTHLQRAWALERAADLTAKADRPRTLALLEESVAEARRVEDDADRARSLVAVATRYEKLDRSRTWDLMYEVTKAANSAPAFTGDDGKITLEMRAGHTVWMTDFNVQEFDLPDVLRALATADLDRAVQLAQGFTNEAARTTAVVAVARAVLVKKR